MHIVLKRLKAKSRNEKCPLYRHDSSPIKEIKLFSLELKRLELKTCTLKTLGKRVYWEITQALMLSQHTHTHTRVRWVLFPSVYI